MEDIEHVHIDEYKSWRFTDHSTQTVKTQLDSIRMWMEWCEKRRYVRDGISMVVESPNTRGSQRSSIVHKDRQEDILNYLNKYHYASIEHAVWTVLCHTGIRTGTLRGFDLSDFNHDDRILEAKHRPKSKTPLKNGSDGERILALSEKVATILSDYINNNRMNTKDHGRDPLFTTKNGRISTSWTRQTVYKWSQPCRIDSCPHSKTPNECEWMNRNSASQCPSSEAPHAIRRGVITALLTNVDRDVVGGRCDVSSKVMDDHYDMRSQEEKAEKRRQKLGL